MLNWARRHFIRHFFRPSPEATSSPYYSGVDFEEVMFSSRDGRRLHGYLMKPEDAPLGTIVHCHGNSGNISNQYEMALFLVHAGFSVLVFDYGGYGQSEGVPSPDSIVEDTRGAIEFIRTRADTQGQRIGLFGQSLGAAAAMEAMVHEPDVAAIAIEGAFTTYQKMAWETFLGRFLFFLTPFVIPDRGPLKLINKIGDRPVYIVHGDSDGLVPVKFAYQLYEKAGKLKGLLILKGFHHLQGADDAPDYTERIIAFFSRNVAGRTSQP